MLNTAIISSVRSYKDFFDVFAASAKSGYIMINLQAVDYSTNILVKKLLYRL